MYKPKNKIIGYYGNRDNKSAASYWRKNSGLKCRAQRSDKGKKRQKY